VFFCAAIARRTSIATHQGDGGAEAEGKRESCENPHVCSWIERDSMRGALAACLLAVARAGYVITLNETFANLDNWDLSVEPGSQTGNNELWVQPCVGWGGVGWGGGGPWGLLLRLVGLTTPLASHDGSPALCLCAHRPAAQGVLHEPVAERVPDRGWPCAARSG
jgi:hypothetical protein